METTIDNPTEQPIPDSINDGLLDYAQGQHPEDNIGEPIKIPKGYEKGTRFFFYCQNENCKSSRNEILWLVDGKIETRCLSCGFISGFIIEKELVKDLAGKETKRRIKRKPTPSYFG